jgi:adenylate cyclase
MVNSLAYVSVGVLVAGVGLSTLVADPKSTHSRGYAVTGLLLSAMMFLIAARSSGVLEPVPFLWSEALSLCQWSWLLVLSEVGLRVARTATAESPGLKVWKLRVAEVLYSAFGLLSVALPKLRNQVFIDAPVPDTFFNPEYYLFAGPLIVASWFNLSYATAMLRSGIDAAERARWGLNMAASAFVATLFLPVVVTWIPALVAVGATLSLWGVMRYLVIQGARNQFLGNFLSPQVRELVSERGLNNALQQSRLQISAIECDLRGFTAFSETAAPEDVAEMLRQYYLAVSEEAAKFAAMIESFAGDGITLLMGAPIADLNHASRSVSLATQIMNRGMTMLARWKELGIQVGMGVGVASGYVTAGVLGDTNRLEYVAIGPAVNLAARLCAHAKSGQILFDQRTVGLAADATRRFTELESAELKGFSQPVKIFTIANG